jgi:O-acetylserine/cysteine efflux transporter
MMLLAPVIGVTSGVTMMGDELTLRMILGGIVAIAGIMIITLRERQLGVPDAPKIAP